MADHEGTEPRDPRSLGERFGAAAEVPAFDLAAALGDLDRATRTFAARLGVHRDADLESTSSARFAQTPAADPLSQATGAGAAISEARMREAEREAREYLEHAKRRADSLVNAMVGAVERDAAEMRREAEADIRARRQAVEVDAARHVEEARCVADRMVAERQQRIAALSDGITGRARALTAGMEDAERVRAQFDAFVRSLARAADRIAVAREPVRLATDRGQDDRDEWTDVAV